MNNRIAVALFGVSISALSSVADTRTLWPIQKSTTGAADLSLIVGQHQYTMDGDSLISVSVVKSESYKTSDGGIRYRYWWDHESGDYTIPSVACGWDIVNNEHVYLEIPIKEVAPASTGSGSVFNGLTSIIVSEGIETLRSAFYGASGLKSVSLPSTLKTIGPSSFCNCSALTSIDIPDSVETIGTRAFSGCNNLRQVKFPASLTIVDEQAFKDSGLIAVTLPQSCVEIGQYAFSGCGGLADVELGGCLVIGDYAFQNCSSLAHIDFPSTLQSIGNSAFTGCSSLSGIGFSQGLISIGSAAFSRCALLNEVTLPDGLVSIGANAFQYCTGISRLSIPSSVSSVGSSAFYNCAPKDLTEGELWTMTYSSVTNFVLLPGLETFGTKFKNSATLERLVLPATIKKIDQEAFSGCTNLVEVVIPDAVENVGRKAFYNCKRLNSLPLLNGSVTNWGGSIFRFCTGIEELRIPENMKEIPDFMFANCSNLQEVVVAEGVETISQSAFLYDDNIRKLSLPSTATNLFYGTYANTDYAKALECATFHQMHPPKNIAKAFLRNFTGVAYYPPDYAAEWKSTLSSEGLADFAKPWTEATEDEPGSVVVNDIYVPYGWLAKYALTISATPHEAAMSHTGKFDASGMPMFVWQDFVAGTDPTDVNSRFRATITIENNAPKIEWHPNLNTNGEVRKYKVLGKTTLLGDEEWAPMNSAHRFFKVEIAVP